MASDAPSLWKRQSWDTSTSFDRFVRFYLPQTPPRSVTEAYRVYRIGRGMNPDKAAALKVPSGSWINWSLGKTPDGVPIEGAKSWAERAAAYDDHLAAVALAAREAQRREAMETGLALDFERVLALKQLAHLLTVQVYNQASDGSYPNIWLADVKQLGSGDTFERVDIVRFNAALIDQLRGVLDDLAKEVGGRKQNIDHTLHANRPIPISFVEVLTPPDSVSNDSDDGSASD